MVTSEAGIRGVSHSCIYGPAFQESIGAVLADVAQAEDISAKAADNGITLIPLIDIPEVIPELESYLEQNPCQFVKDGVCPVAMFAIKKTAREL